MRSGKAFPGGVDGRLYRSVGGSPLTVEPTNPGESTAQVWTGYDGPSAALLPRDLRALSRDLARRADVLDPSSPARPCPPPPPTALAIVLADMRAAAATLTAERLGDATAARVRGWAEVLAHDERWTRALTDVAHRLHDAARYVTPGDDAPGADRLMAALRDLEAVLATPPTPDVPRPRRPDADAPRCVPTTPTERSTPA